MAARKPADREPAAQELKVRKFPDSIVRASKRIRSSVDYGLLVTTQEGLYSAILPAHTGQVARIIRRECFPALEDDGKILDANANIGGDAINFAHNFPQAQVLAVEVNPATAKILERNIEAVGLGDRVTTLVADCMDVLGAAGPPDTYTFVYFDPPWGGPDVWKGSAGSRLFLSGAPVFDAVAIVLRNHLRGEGRGASTVILKAPQNFAEAWFRDGLKASLGPEAPAFTVTTHAIRKQVRRPAIAYLLYVVKLCPATKPRGAAESPAAADGDSGAAAGGDSGAAADDGNAAADDGNAAADDGNAADDDGNTAAAAAAPRGGVRHSFTTAASPELFGLIRRWSCSSDRREKNSALGVQRMYNAFLRKIFGRRASPGSVRSVLALVHRLVFDGSSDYEIVKRLRQAYAAVPQRAAVTQAAGRAASRCADVVPCLARFARGFGEDFEYLDVGTAEGGLAAAIGEALGLPPGRIHGVDLVAPPQPEKEQPSAFVFERAGAERLPYADERFSVVSFIMSLHHVADLDAALAEARRVLAPGGVLMIREHDCTAEAFAVFLDLVHLTYAAVAGDEISVATAEDFERERRDLKSTYRPADAWAALIEEAGFAREECPEAARRRPDQFRGFYAFFTKPAAES